MIYKTRGISLRTIDYSESSIIVKIYTEQFGLQGYLIKGARRKKSSVKANLFQPLSLLELVVYKKEGSQLQSLKEVSVETHFFSIHMDPVKTSILFFLNDVLLRCLHEEEENSELFSFIHETIQTLDAAEKSFSNFHLIFLIRFSRYLGFFPQGNYSPVNSFFDLREGSFISEEPMHTDFLNQDESLLLSKLILSNYYSMDALTVSATERKSLLGFLLRLYQLHLSVMSGISSHKILEEVLV